MGPGTCYRCKQMLTTYDGRCYSVRCHGQPVGGLSVKKPYTRKKITRAMIKVRRKKGRR